MLHHEDSKAQSETTKGKRCRREDGFLRETRVVGEAGGEVREY
jgi:hypothetical protein